MHLGRLQVVWVLACPFRCFVNSKQVHSRYEAIVKAERNAAQVKMIDMDVICEARCSMASYSGVTESVCLQVQRTLAALAAAPEGSELEALLWYQVGKYLESVLLWYNDIGNVTFWQRSHICCMLVPHALHVVPIMLTERECP